jgi:zona occludens toxin (predicted ATPase)
MAIHLITGVPGSGKTLFCVKKIVELQKKFPDRQIYANIDGLNIDLVEDLPSDWRSCPHASIFFIDEAQKIPRYSTDNRKDIDDVAKDLSVHRHSGHDIYFITQSANLLNVKVLEMVATHWHLARILGTQNSTLFTFDSTQRNPNTISVRKNALENVVFSFPKEYYKYYKSSVAHNQQVFIPRKIWYTFAMMIFLILGLIFIYKSLIAGKSFGGFTFGGKEKISSTTSSTTSTVLPASSSASSSAEIPKFEYNFEKPYQQDYSKQKYDIKELPRFAGAVLMGNKCLAYTQQGTIAKISQSDCVRIANGDTPFNPFHQQAQQAQPSLTVKQ